MAQLARGQGICKGRGDEPKQVSDSSWPSGSSGPVRSLKSRSSRNIGEIMTSTPLICTGAHSRHLKSMRSGDFVD